jgi:hypothetical protein
MTIDELAARYVRGENLNGDEWRALCVQERGAVNAAKFSGAAQTKAREMALNWQREEPLGDWQPMTRAKDAAGG